MLFDTFFAVDGAANQRYVNWLESYHKRSYSLILWLLLLGLVSFILWASYFRLDQVARARGEVIASSRVQVIQAVDGGVLAELTVREGDVVAPGQVLARFDEARVGASVKEMEARICALKAQRVRLLAEVTSARELDFPADLQCSADQVQLEQALFEQRRTGLRDELENLAAAVRLAKEEAELVRRLSKSGDVNHSEVIRTQRALNETESRLIVRKNRFLEEATTALTKAEDEIAQNEQVLKQRYEQLDASVFRALVPGIVKNVRVTTVGGVLRAGEELMQIIPIDDELIVEAKVSPTDIGLVRTGLGATLRFDPFDHTIFGGVKGSVRYVSADTLKEDTRSGEEIYYRVHIAIQKTPVTTTTGHQLEILPGMTAEVDIRTGDRTVMDYLLKPLRKTLTTAFGER